jgi:hypothetical protein
MNKINQIIKKTRTDQEVLLNEYKDLLLKLGVKVPDYKKDKK